MNKYSLFYGFWTLVWLFAFYISNITVLTIISLILVLANFVFFVAFFTATDEEVKKVADLFKEDDEDEDSHKDNN